MAVEALAVTGDTGLGDAGDAEDDDGTGAPSRMATGPAASFGDVAQPLAPSTIAIPAVVCSHRSHCLPSLDSFLVI